MVDIPVPRVIRNNLRLVLLTEPSGMTLDQLWDQYRETIFKAIPYKKYGYRSLECFLRAAPDACRIEFCDEDQSLKIFAVRVPIVDTGDGQARYRPSKDTGGTLASVSPRGQASPVGSSKGVFSLCFPAENTPDVVGTLTDMFSIAGKVLEVKESGRMVYVLYSNNQCVNRALKLFSHLGLQLAGPNAPKGPSVSTQQAAAPAKTQRLSLKAKFKIAAKRNPSIDLKRHKKSKKKKRFDIKMPGEGLTYRVFVGNLEPTIKYSFEMFNDLFEGYALIWISIRASIVDDVRKVYAYCLLPCREDAERLAAEYNGHVWLGGRTLIVEVKNKLKDQEKMGADNNADSSMTCEYEDMPGLELAMPGLEPDMPGLEPLVPKLEPAMPGLEPLLPKLEPAMPGLEPGMPGLESDMPGLESDMPGLESDMPGLETVQRVGDGLLPSPRGMGDGLLPLPRGAASGRMNLRVTRKMETAPKDLMPTILIANIRKEITQETILSRFAKYSPSSVNFRPTQTGGKIAFMRLETVEDVQRAIKDLNQKVYHGLSMKVDVPYNMPELREAVFGMALETRKVSLHDHHNLSHHDHHNVSSHHDHSVSYHDHSVSSHHDHNVAALLDHKEPVQAPMTLAEILRMRGECLQILQTPEIPLHLGQQTEVLVTTVISDNFFWGQITDNHCMQQLHRISQNLNGARPPGEPVSGTGRCVALFQGKWYRAWVMRADTPALVRVFYMDYGNTAAVPWTHTSKLWDSAVWDLQPMAVPFTLTEPVTNLRSRELTTLTVEVNALGNLDDGNMVVVRVTSLVPNLKESVSNIRQTLIL